MKHIYKIIFIVIFIASLIAIVGCDAKGRLAIDPSICANSDCSDILPGNSEIDDDFSEVIVDTAIPSVAPPLCEGKECTDANSDAKLPDSGDLKFPALFAAYQFAAIYYTIATLPTPPKIKCLDARTKKAVIEIDKNQPFAKPEIDFSGAGKIDNFAGVAPAIDAAEETPQKATKEEGAGEKNCISEAIADKKSDKQNFFTASFGDDEIILNSVAKEIPTLDDIEIVTDYDCGDMANEQVCVLVDKPVYDGPPIDIDIDKGFKIEKIPVDIDSLNVETLPDDLGWIKDDGGKEYDMTEPPMGGIPGL